MPRRKFKGEWTPPDQSLYVGGYGSSNARIAVVGEAPGYTEVESGFPFAGRTGQMLASDFYEAGAAFDQTYRTNVYKFLPPEGHIDRVPQEEIEKGYSALFEELHSLPIVAVAAVGAHALTALTGKYGIDTYRGSILRSPHGPWKVIPMRHPASLFKQKGGRGGIPWWHRHIIKLDVARAVDESNSTDWDLPNPKLDICHSANQLRQFLYINQDKKRATLDIESIHSVPVCVGIAFSRHWAMSVPLLNMGNWRKPGYGMTEQDQVEIIELLARFLDDRTLQFILQNGKYDQNKLELIWRLVIHGIYADTSLMAHTIHPELPVALEFLSSIYTKQPYYKDEGHEFRIDKVPFENLLLYNGRDCTTQMAVFEELDECLTELGEQQGVDLREFYYGFVNELHEFYRQVEKQGMRFDEGRRPELFARYVEKYKSDLQALERLAGWKVNPSSGPDVQRLLKQLGLPERINPDTGNPIQDEDTLIDLMTYHCKKKSQYEGCRLVAHARKIKRQLTSYLLNPTDWDGRMRTSVRIGGTETGRTSNSNLKPPLRPFIWLVEGYTLKGLPKLKKKPVGTSFMTLTKHGDIGVEFRELFLPDQNPPPDPDDVFLEVDGSQIEARIVAVLAEDTFLIEMFESGKDVHKWTAAEVCFECPESQVTPVMRQVGKFVRHAGHYDMGYQKFAKHFNSEAHRMDLDYQMSTQQSRILLINFHAKSPNIRGRFHADVAEALERNNNTLVTAYGRVRTFYGRPGPELLREALATIPQGDASDHNKKVALRVKKRIPQIKFCSEQHDSLSASVPPKNFKEWAEIIKEEYEKPINYERCSLPRGEVKIPCEIQYAVENLRKMQKWDGRALA